MAKIKHTAEAVTEAIKGSAGIKATISRRLGCHRNSIDRYLAVYPSAALAYKNEVEGIGDMVEQVILEAIMDKDVETAKWYAKNKLKERGYTERVEFKQIKEMSDDELRQAIKERIGADLRDDSGIGPAKPEAPTLH